jgi:hypothetical protein
MVKAYISIINLLIAPPIPLSPYPPITIEFRLVMSNFFDKIHQFSQLQVIS